MPVQLRPAGIADVRLAADLETRARAQEPVDPPTLTYNLANPGAEGPYHLHLVLDGSTPVGVVNFRHPDGAAWEPGRVTNLDLALVPEARAVAPEVLQRLEALARADEPSRLKGWSLDGEGYLNDAFLAAGYEHIRNGVAQDLDLGAGSDRLLEMRNQTRRRMAEQSIALRHGAEVPRERLVDQVVELSNSTAEDMPHTVPEPDMDHQSVEEEMSAPSFYLDRLWTAWDRDRLVAMSFLDFPVERGYVWTHYTASDRAYRGRGIAQAVKNESVGQAIELGISHIRTDNDAQNGPMLAINRKLGYVPIYTIREWLKTTG